MLDFCAAHGIVSEIETIRIQEIEDVRADAEGRREYRFVIRRASLAEMA